MLAEDSGKISVFNYRPFLSACHLPLASPIRGVLNPSLPPHQKKNQTPSFFSFLQHSFLKTSFPIISQH